MLAGILRDQGDFAAARPLYEHALAVTKAARGERHRDYAIGLVNLAFCDGKGRRHHRRCLLEQALEISKTGMGRRHPDYARISIGLAWLRHLRGEDVAARPLLERALAITEATSGELNLANAKTLSNLGWLLAEMGIVPRLCSPRPSVRCLPGRCRPLDRHPAGASTTLADRPLSLLAGLGPEPHRRPSQG